VFVPQEALEKPSFSPMHLRTAVCRSHAALEKEINTTAKGFREIFKNYKPIYLK
jgi:hypothetical protein